jgi:glycosyltransferase involved in cell wall biosynthesis
VVSTSIGAEGLPARDGDNLLIADGGSGFATAVTRVLENANLGRELGQAGRIVLEREFTWDAAWKNLNL